MLGSAAGQPAGAVTAAAVIGALYGLLAVLIIGVAGPVPGDAAVFGSLTIQLLPSVVLPALVFGGAWPGGSWRWGLLLGWGLVAVSAFLSIATAISPPEHETYDTLMSIVNTLIEPLVLFASMVVAATAASFVRGAIGSSQRS